MADVLLELTATEYLDSQRWLTRREAASILQTSAAKLREKEARAVIPRARRMALLKKDKRGDFYHIWVYPLTQVVLMQISGQLTPTIDGNTHTRDSTMKETTSSWTPHTDTNSKLEASLVKDLARRHHGHLTRREGQALSLYYGVTEDGEKRTYTQIAHQMGVSAARTRHLCFSGRRRLIRVEEELTAYQRDLRVASSWGRLLTRGVGSRSFVQ